MERCPVCRARLKGEPLCVRCGCDWSLPLQIEQRAQYLERNAVMRVAKGELAQAEQVLDEALRLKASPLLSALLAFVREQQSAGRELQQAEQGAGKTLRSRASARLRELLKFVHANQG
ncbi:MAG: hypothetical protein O7F73_11155 [Gammaproteobacteria bacterium]|nr:hypothetical protein [Gammaproteobacteria bacterium]